MNTNSNSYTIIYASVIVVVVAFLLAFVSSTLRETQQKNVELDAKKQILSALNIRGVENVDAEYNKYVKQDMLMDADGNLYTTHLGTDLFKRETDGATFRWGVLAGFADGDFDVSSNVDGKSLRMFPR